MKNWNLIFLLGLISTAPALGAMTCGHVFETKLDPMKYVNVPRLTKAGFSISKGDDGTVSLIDDKTKTTISTLYVLDVPYLYEWAGKEEHEAWMQNGGVSTADMKYILASEPQFYGKGYYISTSYSDSASYGSSLTVFKPHRPLVILEYKYKSTDALDTVTALRLRSAGIDGLGSGNETWFSIINEKQLATTSEFLRDKQFEAPPNINYSLDLLAIKISLSHLWDRISTQSVLMKNHLEAYDSGRAALLFQNPQEPLQNSRAFLERLSKAFALNYADNDTVVSYFRELTDKLLPRQRNTLVKYPDLNSASDFMALLKSRSRANVMIRDERAMVTNEQGLPKVLTLDSQAWLATRTAYIRDNLIQRQPLDDENPVAGMQIEYTNLDIIASELGIYKILPASLSAKISAAVTTGSISRLDKTAEGKIMLQESMLALLEILMKPDSVAAKTLVNIMAGHGNHSYGEKTPEEYYQAFVSLHPFAKNNNLAAQIYLEWVTGKLRGKSTRAKLLSTEGPLFLYGQKLEPYLAATEFFNAWITLAADPAQAEIRRQVGLEFLATTYTGKIEELKNSGSHR